MYSMVLMVAMTAAPDTANFNGLFGRLGSGHSCAGSCNGSSCYGSCTGYSSGCSGACSGGPAYYGTTWSQSSPSGCSGSSCCSSSGYNSCYGSGTTPYSSCSGYGIYGGGQSMYYSPGASAYNPVQPYSTVAPTQSVTPPTMDPKTPTMPPILDKKDIPAEKKTLAPTAFQAVVTVNLPRDAKLFAQGQPTVLTSGYREFLTPSLNPGEDYRYNLEVEYTRDGRSRRESKTLIVKAGGTFEVDFVEMPTRRMERISSRIEMILPDGAKLFVNDVERAATSGVREFVTPELAKGEQFVYRFRVERSVEGKTESTTQIVSFEAGEAIRVDFSPSAMNRLTSR